jgi:hypothetical protein
MSCTRFWFHSKRIEGWTAAHEGCDNIYWLPGVIVRLSTYGRMHSGSIEFSFDSQSNGQPCTVEEWCDENNAVQPAQRVKSYTSAGWTNSLCSSRRSHTASFSVEPTTKHISGIFDREDKQLINVLSETGAFSPSALCNACVRCESVHATWGSCRDGANPEKVPRRPERTLG